MIDRSGVAKIKLDRGASDFRPGRSGCSWTAPPSRSKTLLGPAAVLWDDQVAPSRSREALSGSPASGVAV